MRNVQNLNSALAPRVVDSAAAAVFLSTELSRSVTAPLSPADATKRRRVCQAAVRLLMSEGTGA